MSHLEVLRNAGPITEWLTPWDERLIKVTGLEPPIDGGSLREEWSVNNEGWQSEQTEVKEILAIVRKLIVPEVILNRVKPSFGWSGFENGNIQGTIGFEFENERDWRQCMPVNNETLAFHHRSAKGNAAVALCGKTAGLAVICMEFEEGGLDFAIQSIKPDKLSQIVET